MTEENISASESSYEITSVADFLNALKKIEQPKESKNQESTTRFFRGHAGKSFELIPSIYRNDGFIRNEDKIIQETLVHRPDYFASNDTLFEKLVKLQHYGYPTRLLDLTSNPLVALYFTVDSHDHEDGKVIIFDIPNPKIKYYDSDLVAILSAISIMGNNFNPHKYLEDCKLNILYGNDNPRHKKAFLAEMNNLDEEKDDKHIEVLAIMDIGKYDSLEKNLLDFKKNI